MKKRANRLLALLMSAAMVATPYASVTPVFAENVVAVVFIISIVLSCILPENMDIEKIKE